jgi:hypothetical protein
MAVSYKVLGQSNPVVNTLTTLYTVPAGTSSIASTLTICNQGAANAAYRVAIRPANATVTASHYISYDTLVPSNDTIALTLGITLGATDVVSVLANTSSVSFNLFGTEIT